MSSIITRGFDPNGQLLITRGYGITIPLRGRREVLRGVSRINRTLEGACQIDKTISGQSFITRTLKAQSPINKKLAGNSKVVKTVRGKSVLSLEDIE